MCLVPRPSSPPQHPREASPLLSLGATWLRARETPSSLARTVIYLWLTPQCTGQPPSRPRPGIVMHCPHSRAFKQAVTVPTLRLSPRLSEGSHEPQL